MDQKIFKIFKILVNVQIITKIILLNPIKLVIVIEEFINALAIIYKNKKINRNKSKTYCKIVVYTVEFFQKQVKRICWRILV